MTNETNIASAPKKLKQIDMTQAVILFFKNYFDFSAFIEFTTDSILLAVCLIISSQKLSALAILCWA